MAKVSSATRSDTIIEVVREAFAPLMRADPVAFRAKYRKMALDPHAFYRGSACLFYNDVTQEPTTGPAPGPSGSGSTATCTSRTSAPTSTPTVA